MKQLKGKEGQGSNGSIDIVQESGCLEVSLLSSFSKLKYTFLGHTMASVLSRKLTRLNNIVCPVNYISP